MKFQQNNILYSVFLLFIYLIFVIYSKNQPNIKWNLSIEIL